QLGAGLGCADGDAFALEILQAADARFGTGDHLDVVVVGPGNGPQLGGRRPETGILDAVPGIGSRVAQRKGQFATTALQQTEILHRGLSRLNREPGAVKLAAELGKGDTVGVVAPAGTAGEDVDVGRCRADGGGDGQRSGSGEQAESSGQSHVALPSFSFIVVVGRHRSCRPVPDSGSSPQYGP